MNEKVQAYLEAKRAESAACEAAVYALWKEETEK